MKKDPVAAAAKAAFSGPASPAVDKTVQVDPTLDQQISAEFLAFRHKLEALGAKAIVCAVALEKTAGDPKSTYLAHSMQGDVRMLHTMNVNLANTTAAAVAKAMEQGSKLIVPEGEARRQAAERGASPALILPGAAS